MMSPFSDDNWLKDGLSFEEKQQLITDTTKFRGWLIDTISELRSAVSITNKFGCEAFRKSHLKNPENPDSGVTWDSPAGKIGTHGKWGAVTGILMLIIVYMFLHNNTQATVNSEDARLSRDEVAKVVQHQLRQLLSDSKENKANVNEIKEQTK